MRISTIVKMVVVGLLILAAAPLTGYSVPAEMARQSDAERSGGQLTFGLASEPPTLDPHTSGSAWTPRVGNAIFDTLVWQAPDLSFKPYLATSWNTSADGLIWTFQLREGVTFHDGTPFNAEAVKYNLDRVVDPEIQAGSAIGLLGPYESSTVVDEYTIDVNFSAPFAPLLSGLSQSMLGMVSPTAAEASGLDFGVEPVGTGAFIFREWVQRDHITVEKNPDYAWAPEGQDHEGPAYLDQIVFKFIPEEATRVATLQTGETNIIENVPAHELSLLESDDSIQVFTVPIPGAPWHINLNTTRAPLDDPLVRQALIYAVNPQAIVDTLFFGIHLPANGPLNSVTFGYTAAVEPLYEYNPDRARELLEEAGWTAEGDGGIRQKDGVPLSLPLYVIAAGGYDDTAQMVQGQLREVGIDVEIVLEERATMFAGVNAGDHHMALRFWYGSDPDILNLHFNSADEGGWNWSKYNNSEVDSLLAQGAASLDSTERSEIYGEIQEILMEDAVMIPLFEHKYIVAANSDVQGVKFDVRTYPWLYDAYIDQD